MARWLERASPVPPNVARIDDADREALLQVLRRPAIALPAMRPVKAEGPDASCLAPGPGKKAGSRMVQQYASSMNEK
jgi:hypothetical protein